MTEISMTDKLMPSEDVVARIIEDEIIIIPLVDGIGKGDDELFTLNEVGKEIWGKLSEGKTVGQIVSEIKDEYIDPENRIEEEILGFLDSLITLGLIEHREG